jgi:hypothetical protein
MFNTFHLTLTHIIDQLFPNTTISQNGGSVLDVIEKFNAKDKSVRELTYGGGGVIIYMLDDDTTLYKMSKKPNTCETWSSENDKYQQIFKNFDINSHTTLVKLLTPIEYVNTTKICGFSMNWIHNPLKEKFPDAVSIQTMFGDETFSFDSPQRGVFVGIPLLEQLLPNIEDYISELGRFMGYLHYYCKIDGLDLEVIMGKENGHYRLYVIDFDQAQFITYDLENKKEIHNVYWSLGAVSYFPNIYIDNQSYYELFKYNYLEIAKKAGHLDYALKVLELYED